MTDAVQLFVSLIVGSLQAAVVVALLGAWRLLQRTRRPEQCMPPPFAGQRPASAGALVPVSSSPSAICVRPAAAVSAAPSARMRVTVVEISVEQADVDPALLVSRARQSLAGYRPHGAQPVIEAACARRELGGQSAKFALPMSSG